MVGVVVAAEEALAEGACGFYDIVVG